MRRISSRIDYNRRKVASPFHVAKLTTSMEERKAIERELAVAKTSGEDRRVNELNDRLNRLDKVIFDADGDFKDFDSDLKNLLMPFAKDEASYRQSAVIAEPLIQQGYQSMSVNNPRTDVSMRTHSQIFFRRSSKTLTMLFLLSMAYLLLELLLMTHKNHFYSILCALALLAIFGLNYFDKLYIKFVIVLLLLGIVLDFFWLIFKGGVNNGFDVGSLESWQIRTRLTAQFCMVQARSAHACRRNVPEAHHRTHPAELSQQQGCRIHEYLWLQRSAVQRFCRQHYHELPRNCLPVMAIMLRFWIFNDLGGGYYRWATRGAHQP
mgnify:FL=1